MVLHTLEDGDILEEIGQCGCLAGGCLCLSLPGEVSSQFCHTLLPQCSPSSQAQERCQVERSVAWNTWSHEPTVIAPVRSLTAGTVSWKSKRYIRGRKSKCREYRCRYHMSGSQFWICPLQCLRVWESRYINAHSSLSAKPWTGLENYILHDWGLGPRDVDTQ